MLYPQTKGVKPRGYIKFIWYTDKMTKDIITNDKTTNDKMTNGQNA